MSTSPGLTVTGSITRTAAGRAPLSACAYARFEEEPGSLIHFLSGDLIEARVLHQRALDTGFPYLCYGTHRTLHLDRLYPGKQPHVLSHVQLVVPHRPPASTPDLTCNPDASANISPNLSGSVSSCV